MRKIILILCAVILPVIGQGGAAAGDGSAELAGLEGRWLFNAEKTSGQLYSSDDIEEEQKKLQNKLELLHGNQCLDVQITAPGTLTLRRYNRHDAPTDDKTVILTPAYDDDHDCFRNDALGLLGIREGSLVFQPHGSALGLIYDKIR